MIIAFIALTIGSLLASGILFKHDRLLTYLGTAGILLEAQWFFVTLLQRTILSSLPTDKVMDIGGVILLVIWILLWKQWKLSWRFTAWHIKKDVVIIAVLTLTMASLILIDSYNGYQGKTWVTHGFYNGDTVTLAGLVQRSLLTNKLVDENIFAGNGPLEYPTLLHAGLANALSVIPGHDNWLAWLLPISLIQLALLIPIFFLVWDVLVPEPADDWMLWLGLRSWRGVLILQAAIVLFVMGLSWDSFIYPQSHFFILGIYILLAALLWNAASLRGLTQWVSMASGFVMALVLLLSNAISGSAALAITVVFYITRVFDKKRTPVERAIFLALVPVWGVLYKLFTPGNGAFGMPHLSYSAGLDMMKLAPVMLILMLAGLWYINQRSQVTISIAALAAMAFMAYVFSTRNIVVENASRFFYQAILIAFPLLAYPLIRAAFWVKRELVNSTRSIPELAGGWAMVLSACAIFLVPVGTSVISAHNNLIKKDTQKVALPMLVSMDWISAHTNATDIILASPEEPWTVPLFTGRSLLRTNYWLSPGDEIERNVTAAFEGNKGAQKEAVRHADYVLLSKDQQSKWNLDILKKAFTFGDVTVYRTK